MACAAAKLHSDSTTPQLWATAADHSQQQDTKRQQGTFPCFLLQNPDTPLVNLKNASRYARLGHTQDLMTTGHTI